jgi:preprotein translocase subunit Sec63
MNNVTKYVVAGNWNEFINYTKNRVHDDTMYIYVNNVDVMRGLNEISGVFIGTFHLRPDLEEIKWMIQNIKSRKRGFTAQTVASLDPRLVLEDK